MAKAMHRGGTPIAICSIILFIHLLQLRAELGYDLSNRTLLPVFFHKSIFFDRFWNVWEPSMRARMESFSRVPLVESACFLFISYMNPLSLDLSDDSNTVGCPRGRCGLGSFRHERGLPDSHTVFHTFLHGTGAAKSPSSAPCIPHQR
jgi:hypothetical protein